MDDFFTYSPLFAETLDSMTNGPVAPDPAPAPDAESPFEISPLFVVPEADPARSGRPFEYLLSDDMDPNGPTLFEVEADPEPIRDFNEIPSNTWYATVTAIIDGDTIEVDWAPGDEPPAGLSDRVRIAGVDTNETANNEAFSAEATARLAELLPIGTLVRLEADDINSNTLNRPVRHVFVGDVNVAVVLIEEGLGLAASYDFEPGYRAQYFAASELAQVNEAGMWQPGAAGGDPATWPTIEMIVNYDAAGDDANNLNDEYIQIRNTGPGDLDLSNWTARSSARLDDATISIPFGTIVPEGGTYRIYVGSGLATATEMYLNFSEPFFDNTGDVVYLRDIDLNVRATQLWPNTITRAPEDSIVIDDVQFDAPGVDDTNPNGEWIVIRNAGAETVDLTDWRIKDDGFDYAFTDGETLAAGEQLRIYVGSGTDSGSDRYWGLSAGILNNDGGTLEIWTPESQSVDSYAWGTGTSIEENPRGAIRMFANFNASGNDVTNPNGEWVALENTSDSAIDLSGYQLQSGAQTYTFAEGTMLEADANLRVRIGNGTDTSSNLYWGNSTGILANGGDLVDLVNADGETLLRHEWPDTSENLTDYGLVIDAVNFDAPGNDATNPNGEWITIRNSSTTEQNLRNWKIVVGPFQLVSLADRPIAPGETITIYMGEGTNTADTIYWGKSSGILYNSGSRAVELLAPDRTVVEAHSWGSADVGSNQSIAAAIDMSVNYDAAGSDSSNPNGEWINLVNTSSSTISLDGYHLYTDGTSYYFDSGDTLDPGERMRVYRGAGTDAGLDRYAPGLNEFSNTADEVALRPNDSAGVADQFSYPYTSTLPRNEPELEISGVNFDAIGSDATNPNGEWIDITNTGSRSVDLRDYRIQYKTGTFYDFNESLTLAAGDTLRIYMGEGTDTASEIYWGNTSGILSNTEGDLTLQSNYRETLDTYAWPGDNGGIEASIVIDDVQYDAPGSDATNPNGEWIVIRNAGAETVDLTGWRIKEGGLDYAFNDGETLAPGEQLKIYIGSGTDSGSERYWGNASGILANGGQTLEIWSPDSIAVDSYAWGTATSVNENPRGAIRMFANFNASGNDVTNPNGEWVALENTSDSAIDLSGYTLESGAQTYTFADGFTLDADANIRVRIGSGTDTATNLYWGNSAGILANGGDLVDLVNADGDTILRHEWPSSFDNLTDYGLVISEVNFDAEGNDATNPNGEWIVIRNSSTSEQNLRNWKIVVGPYQLVSIADRPIAPGETVTIYMGSGTNTEDTIYWGRSGGILSNDGSRAVELLAPDRTVVEAHSWGSADVGGNQSVAAAIEMTVNYDAQGSDSSNPNGEWVNLVNTSSSAISLDGYQLYTDGTTYTFGAGDILEAGERMRVYRGTGTDSGLDRYAEDLGEFSNTADEVALRPTDSAGVADEFSYPVTGDLPSSAAAFEITAVNYDAEGSDAANPNGEWIEITNTGSKATDLRDWRLQYKTGTFFDFNDSLIVGAGVTIRIYMGEGTNTATELYWGNSAGILSNTAGDLTLQTNTRQTASTFNW